MNQYPINGFAGHLTVPGVDIQEWKPPKCDMEPPSFAIPRTTNVTNYGSHAWTHPLISLMVLAGVLCMVPDGILLSQVESIRLIFTGGFFIGILSLISGVIAAESLTQPKRTYVKWLLALTLLLSLTSLTVVIANIPGLNLLQFAKVTDELMARLRDPEDSTPTTTANLVKLAQSRINMTSWIMLFFALSEFVISSAQCWFSIKALIAPPVPQIVVV